MMLLEALLVRDAADVAAIEHSVAMPLLKEIHTPTDDNTELPERLMTSDVVDVPVTTPASEVASHRAPLDMETATLETTPLKEIPPPPYTFELSIPMLETSDAPVTLIA